MKRRSFEKAYQDIKPDEAARERMLRNILSSASEIPLTGKDEIKMRSKMKPAVIAALIALMALLMGCAIVALNLQDMKIGDFLYSEDYYSAPEEHRDVISLQGYGNSPGKLAAQEWYEFNQTYDTDFTLAYEAEKSGFVAPEEYDAYHVYTQEMIDKVDEITEKYGLKLAGPIVLVQNYTDIFFDSLGLEKLHHQDAPVEVHHGSGYFYGCGNFHYEFWINLIGENVHWPHTILLSMHYSGKEYLDDTSFTVTDIEEAEQWNYQTKDGIGLLIVRSDDAVRILCDREDAFLSVGFDTVYEAESGEIDRMTKETIEQIANSLDFSVKPQKPDVEEAKKKAEVAEAERMEQLKAYDTDEQIYRAHIQNRLDNLEHPENVYYLKWDVNADGTMDLLMGSKEKLEVIFTVMDDENSGTRHITFLPLAEDEYVKWEEVWPGMEIWPITTYPLPSGEQGYQRLIRDGLETMEHPENMYYAMLDVNEDGTLDLLLGSKDQLNVIWTYESSTQQIKFLGYGKDMEELEKAWPNMELWPITEYPLY